jgi:3-hydroxybutyryl-CoA dehydrogenase
VQIFATGEERRIEELKLKFGSQVISNRGEENAASLNDYDVIIDLNADEKFSALDFYASLENKLVVVCAVKKSLSPKMSESKKQLKFHLTGMNLLPTFINRNRAEVSFPNEKDRKAFGDFALEMKTDYLEVEDRTGMVTPRVICMIINEACYSLQEGVASMSDIDKAMKLGTNYPFGPFEWADRIGVKDLYETLEAIWNETQDKRYEICPLLKMKYLEHETFYH